MRAGETSTPTSTDPLVDQQPATPKEVKVAEAPRPHSVYRPDIDGLRTLAVVPVVIFHAYPDAFPGGFVGVDIFFVISGFLISGILFKEFRKGKFTYASFYERRVRRIFPTLILVLTVTFWLAYLYLMAAKLKAMAATMLAGTLFGANLQVLTLEHSYFDLDVKTNPLLHLWSLGVEEQFYIFWPLLASIVVKLSVNKAIALQLVVLFGSFIINVSLLGYHGNDKMSFYMPLSRFWQMSMGGLLAYTGLHGVGTITSARIANGVSIAGLVFVIVGFTVINETSAFPGFWAILPTVGATCLIAAGPNALWNKYVLGNPAAVYIGKISYCLYLWHWPLLVLAKERYPDDRPFFMQPYFVALVSVALSVLTYEDLEGRLRRRKSKLVTPILVLCMVVLAILAGIAYKNPQQFSAIEIEISKTAEASETGPVPVLAPVPGAAVNSITTAAMIRHAIADQDWDAGAGNACAPDSPYITATVSPVPFPFDDPVSPSQIEVCQELNPGHESDGSLVVLGDSHADMSKVRFVQLFRDATANNESFPTVVFKTRFGRAMLPCRPEFAANIAMLKTLKPRAALFVIHWVQYINPGAPASTSYSAPPKCCLIEHKACAEQSVKDVAQIFSIFKEGLAELTALGIKVFVVDQSPEYDFMNPDTWISGETVKVPGAVSRAQWRKEKSLLLQPLRAAVEGANATLIDYADNYSKGDTLVLTDLEGFPVIARGNHLNMNTVRYHLTILDQVVTAART
ncbi:acyltransferase 3 [Achlya hypogyna]|uniref:Acyltransferase 3 n=1 Tax=Achlya hypogyna TaxID=1202772 RepID=A0A1V9Z1T7_ACHHY|nr:acyltransferase 3 [Achlya hypogyna]